jgi:hypothetical protein
VIRDKSPDGAESSALDHRAATRSAATIALKQDDATRREASPASRARWQRSPDSTAADFPGTNRGWIRY